MRLTRSYVDVPLPGGTELVLPEATANHLVRVLRLREGDTCILFNGDGNDVLATLVAAGKRDVRVRLGESTAVGAASESPLRITLLQGIARGEKMDLILQKATELGVAEVVAVVGERTEVKLDAERAAKRVQHWHSVLASACEQSGRAVLPSLAGPIGLADALRLPWPQSLKLTLDPTATDGLSDLYAPASGSLVVAIGPEGGWSPRDRDALGSAGFTGLRLGPRVLRTETAGLTALAILQSRFGDLR